MASIAFESITSTEIGGEAFLDRWGSIGTEYVVNGLSGSSQQDFQDLMVYISEKRATAIEQQVTPMQTRMTKRNTNLNILGDTLGEIQKYLDQINTTKEPKDQTVSISSWSETAQQGLALAGVSPAPTGSSVSKGTLDEIYQKVKTKIDRLNNDSSQDSTRLQSLVDHRDQSYQTATTLMTSISDTRSNLIKSI